MTMFSPELFAEFVTESTEHLADIEIQLLDIESAGADIDVELVNTVFRGIHSIKGVAGFLGLTTINELSHGLEDVLNRIRNRDLVPTPAIVEVLLKSSDELRSLIVDCDNSNDRDVSEHLQALSAIQDSNNPSSEDSKGEHPMQDPAELTEKVLDAVEAQLDSAQDIPVSPPESQKPAEPSSPKTEEAPSTTSSAPTDTNIRVPVATLDNLMNLAGELVLNRNRLLQFSSRGRDGELESISSDFDQITCALQDAIMQTRMQPIATAFNRFPRVVRDLSSKLNKECKLVMEGKDVEVDKSIIEAMSDPLTHLVRNAVDHGIELPAARQAAGKNTTGTIRLSAYHRAGQVCIDISDDGGGIDPARLRDKAIEKGIITTRQAEEMSNTEALRLILHPGFSTAEKLTDVSGRGVGMDVVRTNIERIGGTVDVESHIGQGSTIHIVLPLTLAIIRSLIVECQSRRFAVPQVNVAELVRVSEKDKETCIDRINGAVVFRLRGELLPLVNINEVLGLTSDDEQGSDNWSEGALNVAVLESGRSRYGIVVDAMHDSEEIVVKPLGRHLKSCLSLAGATILGDGQVALILDVSGIAERSQLSNAESNQEVQDVSNNQSDTEYQKLLLFKNSPAEQFAIPMVLVTRIERMLVEDIEGVGGKQVIQYRGGMLPLISVEDTINAQPRAESKFINVVILEARGHEFGIIAPSIEDIRDVPVDIDTGLLCERGVIGSQVIEGMTTRLLDAFQMVEVTFPETAQNNQHSGTVDDDSQKTILLAEDSNFFRKQVSSFLQESGYQILEAEDGAIAWDMLCKNEDAIDAVVTDIEMPNMNGFEFCQKIRNHSQYDSLPVLALTSLAGDEDVKRGKECGINEYQVKMDRQKLTEAIQRLTTVSI